MKELRPAKIEEDIFYGEGLDPLTLRKKLWRYQKELGRKFDLEILLKVEEIRTRVLLAEAISQLRRFYESAPEKERSS